MWSPSYTAAIPLQGACVFPLSIDGSVHFDSTGINRLTTLKTVADRIADKLLEKQCTDVYVEGSRVRFHNAVFGGTIQFGDWYSGSFFQSFGSGAFDVEAAIDGITVRYNLSQMRMIAVLALVTAVAALMINGGRISPDFTIWPFPAGVFLTIFVIVSAYHWLRAQFWLRNSLRDLPELQRR